MNRILPHSFLALFLLVAWMLLSGSASLGTAFLGSVLAVGGSWAFASLKPPLAQLRQVAVIPGLLCDVVLEVVRSNYAVARIILSPATEGTRRSGFVRIPLDMRDPYGLAALACIITATPGTVWAEYDAGEHAMLLHVLDLVDEAEWVRTIKEKWERRLMEIFE
ncbi:Na+/H+ antiporter subunit E [Falsiroseomonas sp. HW251]|uniref:Na+/H+ antiporter subunit E n=1 Tax=Falsiroseomonas sp. HW251 TaxID=3390998 RepID=UPI003D3184F3